MFEFSKRMRWVFALNMVVALLLLMVYVAPFVPADEYWWMGIMALFYPSLFWINVVFVVFWAIKKKGYFALSFLMLLVGYKQFSKAVGFDFSDNQMGQNGHFKVCSYNVRNFDLHDFMTEKEYEKDFKNFFSQQQPDVICFQELFSLVSPSGYSYIDTLKKHFNYNHYYLHTEEDSTEQYHGICILSKYPIVAKEKIDHYEMEGSKNGSVYADIRFPGQTIRVYSIHLQSVQLGQGLDFKPAKSFEFLPQKLARAYNLRYRQLHVLMDNIEKSPYPVVVAGDFNEPPMSYLLQKIKNDLDLKDGLLEAGVGYGSTVNSRFGLTRIDYILASSSLQLNDFHVERPDLSDHLPLFVEVSY